jgi:hypothetical protein
MTHSNENAYGKSSTTAQSPVGTVTLRGPADLADALPYLMGFHIKDGVVLVALHGEFGRFGGRVHASLPEDPDHWPAAAAQLAERLVGGSERRGGRPDGIVAFLCRDPVEGERPGEVMERLRPLAQRLRVACGALDVPVVEALCLSAGRWWSYCRPDSAPMPADGVALPAPGSSEVAAAATLMGIPAPASLAAIEARLRPSTERHHGHEAALDAACAELVPRMLGDDGAEELRRRTVGLARAALRRYQEAPRLEDRARGDARDDSLLTDAEAAAIILGLQDRTARDRAAEWMEPGQADAALRLWRALARRCAGPYAEHAAAPLSLAGWVAWSSGDETEARVALRMALDLEPQYTFARLLHTSVCEGLDPELLRSCLRHERRERVRGAVTARRAPVGSAGRGPRRHSPGGRRARTRR